MRIVITGSSGRIGRALHQRLAPRHQVVGLDRVPAPTTTVVCDLLDAGRIRAALVGADAIVHLAALHSGYLGVVPDAEFRRINVEGTRVVAGAAIAVGVSRFVHGSTTALYGGAVDPAATGLAAWIDEAATPRPQILYHETRLRAEQIVRSYGEAGALAVTILRISRCLPEPLPARALHRLHCGIDTRDVATVHERALESFVQGGVRLYVVSANTPFQPRDCARLAHDAPAVLRERAPALVETFARRGWPLPQVIDRIYDASLARRALGWTPLYGFEDVLAEAAQGTAAAHPQPQSG